jgi:hypothetical protein
MFWCCVRRQYENLVAGPSDQLPIIRPCNPGKFGHRWSPGQGCARRRCGRDRRLQAWFYRAARSPADGQEEADGPSSCGSPMPVQPCEGSDRSAESRSATNVDPPVDKRQRPVPENPGQVPGCPSCAYCQSLASDDPHSVGDGAGRFWVQPGEGGQPSRQHQNVMISPPMAVLIWLALL